MLNLGSASQAREGRWKPLVVSLALLGSVASGATAGTLEDSIRATLETNPEIGVVKADREAIDQELRQAKAGYLPSLDLRGAAGPEYTDSPATRNDRSDGSTETLMRYESQLTLSQMLFDGFATQSEVQRQTARIDSAARRVQETSEFIALDAVEAHLDVLRNKVLVELARENLAEHQKMLGRVSQLEREGAGSIADVVQTQARVAAAKDNLAIATRNLRDAEALYLRVVGLAADSLEEPLVPVQAVPESQEAAAISAAASNPTVQIANADIDVAEAELEGARAGYYPRFDVELGAGANRNLDGIDGKDIDAQALLVVRYNLFRGGEDIAREREAYSRVNETRESLRKVRREAEESARVAYNALVAARDRVEALKPGVEAQRATRDIYAQQFDLGQRSLLDLLDAQNQLFLGRSDLATAEYTEKFAVYRVLAEMGDLLQTLDIQPPREAISIHREAQPPIQEEVPSVAQGSPSSEK